MAKPHAQLPWSVKEQLEIPAKLRESIECIRLQSQSQNAHSAIESLAELLNQSYSTPEEWLSLAQEGIRLQSFDQARAACNAAANAGIQSVLSLTVYAGLLQELCEDERAQQLFLNAIQAEPSSPLIVYRLGTFFLEKGRPEEAINLYEGFLCGGVHDRTSALLPDLYASLAVAKLALGMNEEAIEVLLILFSLHQEHCDYNFLMGLALKNLNENEQAADFFRKALSDREYSIDTILYLADCLIQLDRPDLALLEYEKALIRYPDDPENEVLSLNMAQVCFRLGDNDKAIAIYNAIIERDPDHVFASYLLLFSLSVCGRPQVCRMRAVAENLWRSYRSGHSPPILGTATSNAKVENYPSQSERDSVRIKIGILSSEIGDHVVGMFMTPLLENYNRDRLCIDLICLREWADPRAEYLRSLANSTVRLRGLTDFEAREVIRRQHYDIILETSGYTHSASLFILAERCAPIQCHYIGFHATTGLDTIDYFIGDNELLASDVSDQFSEKLWRLRRPWLARSKNDGLPIAYSKATHCGPVFGCFSSLQKITDSTIVFWGRALFSVPDSVLLIKDRLAIVPKYRDRLLAGLAQFDIDPSRVSFLGKTISWQEHMDFFNLIDIAFDTTPWSGATTAFDTLSMGVPLIGIRGNSTSGRMSSSVLSAIGRQHWISSTPEEFVQIADLMARDFTRIRQEKQVLQNHVLSSPLFDGAGLAKELESAFVSMANATREVSDIHLIPAQY